MTQRKRLIEIGKVDRREAKIARRAARKAQVDSPADEHPQGEIADDSNPDATEGRNSDE